MRGKTFIDTAISLIEEEQEEETAPLPLATHVAFVFLGDDGVWQGIEARPPVVRTFNPQVYTGPSVRRYLLPLSPQQGRRAYAQAVLCLGRPYAFDALLAALTYVARGRPFLFFEDPWARTDCSELLVHVLRASGFPVLDGVPASNVTPSSLEGFACRQGWVAV